MKSRFQNALIKALIERNDFMPITDDDGNMRINGKINIVMNSSTNGSYIVEIVDGDELSCAQITDGLQRNQEILTKMDTTVSQDFFKVFVFEAEPDEDKFEAITNGELHNIYQKRYLKGYCVNLKDRKVYKNFEAPINDSGLLKAISGLLSAESFEEVAENDIETLAHEKQSEYRLELKANYPIATYSLIAINILVGVLLYLYATKSGTSYTQLLYDFGAKVNERIIAGEYFRFITPIFLHAGTTHLLINCFSLYAVGVNVERIYGRKKFLTAYFVAGILGNVASFMFSPSWGVGASGAIFGLMGVLLYFGMERPVLFKKIFGYNILLTIVVNLVYGFSTTGIDNYAHIGGLIGGFLAMGAISKPEKARWYFNRLLYIGLIILLFSTGIFYGFHSDVSKIAIKVTELEKYDKASDWKSVISTGKEILELEPKNADTKADVLWAIAKAEALTGEYTQAIKYGEMLKDVDAANGHYLLGLLYYDTQNYERSKSELTAAKNAGATYEQIDKLLAEMK